MSEKILSVLLYTFYIGMIIGLTSIAVRQCQNDEKNIELLEQQLELNKERIELMKKHGDQK